MLSHISEICYGTLPSMSGVPPHPPDQPGLPFVPNPPSHHGDPLLPPLGGGGTYHQIHYYCPAISPSSTTATAKELTFPKWNPTDSKWSKLLL